MLHKISLKNISDICSESDDIDVVEKMYALFNRRINN